MRKELETGPKPKYMDTRVVTKFLWFPKTLHRWEDGKEELRWLESAKIRQRYTWGVYSHSYYWEDSYWEEENE